MKKSAIVLFLLASCAHASDSTKSIQATPPLNKQHHVVITKELHSKETTIADFLLVESPDRSATVLLQDEVPYMKQICEGCDSTEKEVLKVGSAISISKPDERGIQRLTFEHTTLASMSSVSFNGNTIQFPTVSKKNFNFQISDEHVQRTWTDDLGTIYHLKYTAQIK
jgi:predicted nucleotide-binding protein